MPILVLLSSLTVSASLTSRSRWASRAARRKRRAAFVSRADFMTDWVLYLDESGDTDAHQIPLQTGKTPIFSISGVVLPCGRWRDYDREYLYLKREFFKKEMDDSSQLDTGWEAKGNFLLGPRNAKSERNRVFVEKVLSLINAYGGKIFGVAFVKSVESPMSKASIYTKGFQILAERFEIFLRERGTTGFIIADSRMAHLKKGGGLDYTVAISYLSYIFGHAQGRTLTRIVEAPLFADSKLTVGLQIADVVSMIIFANCYNRFFKVDVNKGYLDYSHIEHHWPKTRSTIFESEKTYYENRKLFGLRTLDYRDKKTGE